MSELLNILTNGKRLSVGHPSLMSTAEMVGHARNGDSKKSKFQWQACEPVPLRVVTILTSSFEKTLLAVVDPFRRGTPRKLPTIFEFLKESRSSHRKVFLCVWPYPAWPMLRLSLCLPMLVSSFAMPYRSLLLGLDWTDFQPSKRILIVQQERLDFTSTKHVPRYHTV